MPTETPEETPKEKKHWTERYQALMGAVIAIFATMPATVSGYLANQEQLALQEQLQENQFRENQTIRTSARKDRIESLRLQFTIDLLAAGEKIRKDFIDPSIRRSAHTGRFEGVSPIFTVNVPDLPILGGSLSTCITMVYTEHLPNLPNVHVSDAAKYEEARARHYLRDQLAGLNQVNDCLYTLVRQTALQAPVCSLLENETAAIVEELGRSGTDSLRAVYEDEARATCAST